jgi:hypothetical protein
VAEGKATITYIKLLTFRRYENLHHGTWPRVLKATATTKSYSKAAPIHSASEH